MISRFGVKYGMSIYHGEFIIGMTQEMVNNIVENGKVLSQNNGNKFAYITQEGVAIVSKEGKLITAWSSADFDSSMLEIISKLFGE